MKYPIIFFIFFASLTVKADNISSSNNIVERFIYKDWVTYKETRLCRPMSEFLIGGSLASLALFFKGWAWHDNEKAPYRFFIYGHYIKSYKLKLNGVLIEHEQISQTLLGELANSSELTIEAEMYKDYKRTTVFTTSAKISLSGSSAAFRFCEFIE